MGKVSKPRARRPKRAKETTTHPRGAADARESLNHLRMIIETEPECVKVVGRDGFVLEMNPAGLAILEATKLEQVQKQSLLEFVAPEFRDAWQDLLARVFKGESGTLSYEATGLKGRRRWFETNAAPFRDESGKVTAFLGITRDITERKEVEGALRESEANFRALFEQAAVGVAQIETMTGRFARVNRRYGEIVGYTEEEMRRLTFQEITHPEDLPTDLDNMARLHRGEIRDYSMEKRYLRKDGAVVWVHLTVSAPWHFGGTSDFHTAVVEDITARKQTEETVTKARNFYLRLFDEFPTPIWRAGVDAKCDYFNRAWLDFTGRTMDQELGDGWAEGVHPGDLERCLQIYREAFAARRPFEMSYRLRASAGGYRWITDFGQPFYDLAENFAGYVGTCFDITERRWAEEALRAREQSYSTLVKNIAGAVYRCRNDPDWTVEFISDGCFEITGYRADEIAGNRVTSLGALIHPEDAAAVWEKCQANLDARQACNSEYRILHRNGEVRWVWDQAQGSYATSGELLFIEGLITDITARKEAERAAERSLKELRVLYLSSLAFGQSRDPERVGRQIIETMEQLLDYRRGSIWMKKENSPELALLAHSDLGLEPGALGKELIRVRALVPRLGEGIAGWVARQGEPVRSGDVRRDHRYLEADPAVQSELCVPLKVGGRTIGSINVESYRPDAFAEHDERLLTTLANQAAIAIENARLFHELQLDLAERKRAEEELRASKQRFLDIFTFAPVGIYQSLHDGRLITANRALAEMLGYASVEELLKVNLDAGIFFDVNERRRMVGEYTEPGYAVDLDTLWKRKDGSLINVQLSAHAIKGPTGETQYFEGFVRDVTERKQAEKAVSRYVGQQKQLLETTLDGYILADTKGQIVEVNPAYCALIGYSREELRAMNIRDVEGQMSPAEIEERIAVMLEQGRASFETKHRSRDGQVHDLEVSTVILPAESQPLVAAFVRDITARKLAEEELKESGKQLRALLARLRRAREEERIRVSREIHDELGQLLTGLKMDVRWLERKLSEPGLPAALNPLLDRAVEASELAESTIAAVQKIAAELRPGTLDELGLEPALHAEGRRFEERSGIRCTVEAQAIRPALTPEVANELFYICQEALTNVARHARATSVEIRLQMEGDTVVLEVRDDGAGMPRAKLKSTRALGLLGMKERAMQCGGTISFAGSEPQGTRVIVRVPRVTLPAGEREQINDAILVGG